MATENNSPNNDATTPEPTLLDVSIPLTLEQFRALRLGFAVEFDSSITLKAREQAEELMAKNGWKKGSKELKQAMDALAVKLPYRVDCTGMTGGNLLDGPVTASFAIDASKGFRPAPDRDALVANVEERKAAGDGRINLRWDALADSPWKTARGTVTTEKSLDKLEEQAASGKLTREQRIRVIVAAGIAPELAAQLVDAQDAEASAEQATEASA